MMNPIPGHSRKMLTAFKLTRSATKRSRIVSDSAAMHAETPQLCVRLIPLLYSARGEPQRAQTNLDTKGSES